VHLLPFRLPVFCRHLPLVRYPPIEMHLHLPSHFPLHPSLLLRFSPSPVPSSPAPAPFSPLVFLVFHPSSHLLLPSSHQLSLLVRPS